MGVYVPWYPDAKGRWQSRLIPVAITFEGVCLVVYSGSGRRQLREEEVARTVANLEERLTGQDEAIARRDEAIAVLRRRLKRRRKA